MHGGGICAPGDRQRSDMSSATRRFRRIFVINYVSTLRRAVSIHASKSDDLLGRTLQ
jgi:hypothetical protein